MTADEERIIRAYAAERLLPDEPEGKIEYAYRVVREGDRLLFLREHAAWNYHDESWTELELASVSQGPAPGPDRLPMRDRFDWKNVRASRLRIPGCEGVFTVTRAEGSDRRFVN